MSRWLLNLLFLALLLSILAMIPLAYRAYEPIEKNNRAVEALHNKQYDRAIDLLSDAIRNSPDNKVFRQNLVAAYNSKAIELEKREQDADALAWYEKALTVEPGNQILLRNYVSTLNNVAVALSNARKFPDSQELFERAGRRLGELDDGRVRGDVRRNYSALLTLWGAELMKRNQFEPSKAAFRQSLELDTSNTIALIYLGDLHYEVNEYADAKRQYAAALPLDRENADYLRNRLAMIDDETKVESLFKTVKDPRDHFLIQYVEYTNGVQVPEMLEMLHGAYDTVGQSLGIFPARAVSVKVYNTRDFFKISRLPEWAVGIFDGKMRLKVEDIQSAPAQVRDLLFHEYTHAVLAMNIKQRIPAWFHEGMAQLMEPQFAESPREQSQMRDALARKPLSFDELKESFKEINSRQDAESAYLMSKYFLADLNRRYGRAKLPEWIKVMAEDVKFEDAFQKVYGLTLADAQAAWIRNQLRK
jgi:tetratricopeptide (TPR) repeat protein